MNAGDDSQQDSAGRPRPSSPLGRLLEQAIVKYDAARDSGRWVLAQKHRRLKKFLEDLIFGTDDDR
jgi:hypothetical protein